MANENMSALVNMIIKLAEKTYKNTDSFKDVKTGTVEEYIDQSYKLKLSNSDEVINASTFGTNLNLIKGDSVYVIKAESGTDVSYYILGKVNDVRQELAKSDWSRFVEVGGDGTQELEKINFQSICNETVYDILVDTNNTELVSLKNTQIAQTKILYDNNKYIPRDFLMSLPQDGNGIVKISSGYYLGRPNEEILESLVKINTLIIERDEESRLDSFVFSLNNLGLDPVNIVCKNNVSMTIISGSYPAGFDRSIQKIFCEDISLIYISESGNDLLASVPILEYNQDWHYNTVGPLSFTKETNENFINSINENGYFAIYGDFTCTDENETLKEYGLKITLFFDEDHINGENFVYKFGSQDFTGQPFNITNSITQKKIFKIEKEITALSIQGFENGGDNSTEIGLSNLVIAAGSLYMLDPEIKVEIAAAAGTKDYFDKSASDTVLLEATVTQRGQNIFSSLINYIWYINDPTKQNNDENYWIKLNEQSDPMVFTDLEGNSITIDTVKGKVPNLYLYKGTAPNLSGNISDKYLLKEISKDNTKENIVYNESFGRKIKCDVTYEGYTIESEPLDIWDYVNESYNIRIDSSMQPVTFYPSDSIDTSITLTAERIGGPQSGGPKHNFVYSWSVENNIGEVYKINKTEEGNYTFDAIDKVASQSITIYHVANESDINDDKWKGRYIIKEATTVRCDLLVGETNLGSQTQNILIASEQSTRIETHYQYYIPNRGNYGYDADMNLKENYIIEINRDNNSSNDTDEYFFETLVLNNTNFKTNPLPDVKIEKIITYKKNTGIRQEESSLKDSFNASVSKEGGYITISCSGNFPGEDIEKMKIYCTLSGELKEEGPISNWNHITFEKAFRETWDAEGKNRLADPVWYGEWNIQDDQNEGVDWNADFYLAQIDYDFNNRDIITESTTKFSYSYFYENGLTNDAALDYILNLPIGLQNALYVTSRRVWIETEIDENGVQKEIVGRQEEWAYPQILKATKSDLDTNGKPKELVQEALDKLNTFNSLTSGGRDQGVFWDDVYILTKDTLPNDNKIYYKKIYNEDNGTFDYNTKVKGSDLEDDANPRELFLYELKENQVYINAEYIQTGALRVGDPEQGHIFYADIDQKEVEIGGFTVDKDTLKTNDYAINTESEESEQEIEVHAWNGNNGIAYIDVIPHPFKEWGKIEILNISDGIKVSKTDIALGAGEYGKDRFIINLIYSGPSDTPPSSIEIQYKISTMSLIEGFALSSNQNKNMIDSKYFKVSHAGALTSTSGHIGGFEIGDNYLRSDDYKENLLQLNFIDKITEEETSVNISLRNLIEIGWNDIEYISVRNINEEYAYAPEHYVALTKVKDSVINQLNENSYLIINLSEPLIDSDGSKKECVAIRGLNFSNINKKIKAVKIITTNLNHTGSDAINEIWILNIYSYNLGFYAENYLIDKYYSAANSNVKIKFSEDESQFILDKNIRFFISGTLLGANDIHVTPENLNYTYIKRIRNASTSEYSTELIISPNGFQLSSNPTENMIDSKYFKVSHQGEIEATSGKIANWVLDSVKLYSKNLNAEGNSINGTGMSHTSTANDPAFWAGYSGSGANPWDGTIADESWTDNTKFYVTNAGRMVAKEGKIGPFELTENGLESDKYIRLDAQEAYFPQDSSFNIGDKVHIFAKDDTNMFISTKNSANFTIQNYSGAGIRFNKDTELINKKINLTITGPDYSDGNGFRYNPSTSDRNQKYTVYFDIHYSFNQFIPNPLTVYFYLWWADVRPGVRPRGQNKRFSFTIPAYSQNGTASIKVIENIDWQYSPYGSYSEEGAIIYYPPSDFGDGTKSGISSTNHYSSNNSFTSVVDSYSETNNSLYSLGNFIPDSDGTYTLGRDGAAWGSLSINTPSLVNSDVRLKNTIKLLNSRPELEIFYNNLKPSSYKYNNGTSDRLHIGFIAQDVEASLKMAGIDTKDFAGLCIPQNENHYYSIRYSEFIALNTDQIQKLKKRESELEDKVAQLELQIKEIKGEI